MATRVVKLQRKKDGTIIQGCDVYIGRRMTMGGWNLPQSKWMNPFTAKEHGQAGAVKKFDEYIRTKPELLADIEELRGKVLGCWCKKSSNIPCHGDVLVKLLKENDSKQSTPTKKQDLAEKESKPSATVSKKRDLAEKDTRVEIKKKKLK